MNAQQHVLHHGARFELSGCCQFVIGRAGENPNCPRYEDILAANRQLFLSGQRTRQVLLAEASVRGCHLTEIIIEVHLGRYARKLLDLLREKEPDRVWRQEWYNGNYALRTGGENKEKHTCLSVEQLRDLLLKFRWN